MLKKCIYLEIVHSIHTTCDYRRETSGTMECYGIMMNSLVNKILNHLNITNGKNRRYIVHYWYYFAVAPVEERKTYIDNSCIFSA